MSKGEPIEAVNIEPMLWILGTILFLLGGCFILAGAFGLIPTPPFCSFDFGGEPEQPSPALAALAGVIGAIIAGAGVVVVLRTKTFSRKPLSILESSKQPGD